MGDDPGLIAGPLLLDQVHDVAVAGEVGEAAPVGVGQRHQRGAVGERWRPCRRGGRGQPHRRGVHDERVDVVQRVGQADAAGTDGHGRDPVEGRRGRQLEGDGVRDPVGHDLGDDRTGVVDDPHGVSGAVLDGEGQGDRVAGRVGPATGDRLEPVDPVGVQQRGDADAGDALPGERAAGTDAIDQRLLRHTGRQHVRRAAAGTGGAGPHLLEVVVGSVDRGDPSAGLGQRLVVRLVGAVAAAGEAGVLQGAVAAAEGFDVGEGEVDQLGHAVVGAAVLGVGHAEQPVLGGDLQRHLGHAAADPVGGAVVDAGLDGERRAVPATAPLLAGQQHPVADRER